MFGPANRLRRSGCTLSKFTPEIPLFRPNFFRPNFFIRALLQKIFPCKKCAFRTVPLIEIVLSPFILISPFHPYYYTQRTHMRCARTSPGGTHRTHMRHAGTSPGGPRHGPPSPLPYLPCHLTRAPVASKVRVWGRCRLCHTVCLAATRDAAECHA